MRHFKKKNLKIFSPWEPHENVSPSPAVARDRPGSQNISNNSNKQIKTRKLTSHLTEKNT